MVLSKLISLVNEQSDLERFVDFFAVILSLYHIYYAATFFVPRGQHTALSIGLSLILCFLIYIIELEEESQLRWLRLGFYLVAIIIAAITSVYFFDTYRDLSQRVLDYRFIEYVFGGLLLLLIIEVSRRSYGNTIAAVIILSIGYAYFGPYLPSIFEHQGINIQRIIEQNVLALGSGIFGPLSQIGPTWIAVFLIYAGILEAFGALELFLSAGRKVGKHLRSGVAQTAVVSSLLMGSISGSAAANVATTGSFTIPLMKEHGINGRTAGAIESAASSGGQLMPPIMGAAAFLMAAILDLRYLEVLKIGLLPALLFYISMAFSVHAIVVRSENGQVSESTKPNEPVTDGAGGDPPVELEQSQQEKSEYEASIGDAIPITISVLVLIYYLAWRGYGPLGAAYRTIIVLLVVAFVLRLAIEKDPIYVTRSVINDLRTGLKKGGKSTAPLVAVVAGIAIFITMINAGNFIQFITFLMLDLAGNQLYLLLILAMFLSILLGMGLPTAAAYILVAIMVAPAVSEFGLAQVYGHMFVFYAAVLSALTPPVAIACMVASNISGAGFFYTCREALKIAVPAFILPYAFIIHPELLIWESTTVLTFSMMVVAMLGLVIGIHGFVGSSMRPILSPLLLGCAGLILLVDGFMYNGLGIIGICIVVAISQLTKVPLISTTSN